jgi:hypothetical protein
MTTTFPVTLSPILRFSSNHPQYSTLIRQRPEWVKDTIKYEVAQAERFTGADIGRAQARQTQMYDRPPVLRRSTTSCCL